MDGAERRHGHFGFAGPVWRLCGWQVERVRGLVSHELILLAGYAPVAMVPEWASGELLDNMLAACLMELVVTGYGWPDVVKRASQAGERVGAVPSGCPGD